LSERAQANFGLIERENEEEERAVEEAVRRMEAMRAEMERERDKARAENQRLKDKLTENRRGFAHEQENVAPEFNQQVKELRNGLQQTEAALKSEIFGKTSLLKQYEALEGQLNKQRSA
jgi:hypothetical protein